MPAPHAIATFLVQAPDQPGLVARLAGFFYQRGLNIVDASNHTEIAVDMAARFFMRLAIDVAPVTDCVALGADFATMVDTMQATFRLAFTDVVPRVAILCIKDPACLYDVVLGRRARLRHPGRDLEPRGSRRGRGVVPDPVRDVADHHRQQAGASGLGAGAAGRGSQPRALHADAVGRLFGQGAAGDQHPPWLSAGVPRRPAAPPGACARGQAHRHTAHYPTAQLDDGPIIEQDVARVSHAMGTDDMIRVGRDVERVVLAQAVRAHLENRVVVHGRRTVVL